MINRVDVDMHTLAARISSAPNKNPSSTPMYYLCVAYTLSLRGNPGGGEPMHPMHIYTASGPLMTNVLDFQLKFC